MLSILAIAAMMIATSVNSQTLIRLKQAAAGDTIKASGTYYAGPANVNFSNGQVVSATIAIDSVSGTPNGTATLEQSVDGIHWNTTGSTKTWKSTAANWKYTNSVGSSVSDTCFILSLNPFLGAYVRIKIVATSTTQKSKWWATVKSSNMY